jgi:hypothetical protein
VARLTLRRGVWCANDAPCASYAAALKLTLQAAEIGLRAAPQVAAPAPRVVTVRTPRAAAKPKPDPDASGNSERGSRQVVAARLAWLKAGAPPCGPGHEIAKTRGAGA